MMRATLWSKRVFDAFRGLIQYFRVGSLCVVRAESQAKAVSIEAREDVRNMTGIDGLDVHERRAAPATQDYIGR
jgi:hypothetical protein